MPNTNCYARCYTNADSYLYFDDDTDANAYWQAEGNTQTTPYVCAAASTVTNLFSRPTLRRQN